MTDETLEFRTVLLTPHIIIPQRASMLNIRTPDLGDIPAIIGMAKAFQRNSLFRDCGFDENKVHGIIHRCMDPTSPYFMVVGLEDGKVLGAFCGSVSEYFFSRERIATDLAIYVNPEDRRFAYKFLNKAVQEFEAWAKSRGAREVCIAPASGAYSPAFEKYLVKKNYKKVGFISKKGI